MAEKSTGKKWKGKTWFTVLAPNIFREKEICEIPATDPKYVKGRKIGMGLEDLTGDYKKFARFPATMDLKIISVDGDKAKTVFGGFEVSKDFIFRATRKRTQKVMLTDDFKTKDGWDIQVTGLVILNRNVYDSIRRSARKMLKERLQEFISKNTMDDVLKDILNRVTMGKIRKDISKIYPVRIAEITKIEVVSRPE